MIRLPRSTFLQLACITLDKFQSLQRRNQQPRWREPLDNDEPDAAGYFAFEALLLLVADKVYDNTALDRSEAKQLVEKHNTEVMRLVFDHEESKSDQLVVSVVRFMDTYELACGPYEDIISGFEDLKKNWREEFAWGAIFLISKELKELMDRAELGGIKLLKN